jgi:hypothetical protein
LLYLIAKIVQPIKDIRQGIAQFGNFCFVLLQPGLLKIIDALLFTLSRETGGCGDETTNLRDASQSGDKEANVLPVFTLRQSLH